MSKDHKETTSLSRLSDLLTLNEAAKLSGLSASHLRLLVRSGKLWGVKLGRNWFTANLEIKQYLSQERKPGARKKQDKNK